MTLFRQYFRTQLSGLLIWAGAAALTMLMMTRSTPTDNSAEAMQALIGKMPESFKIMFGVTDKLGTVDGFVAIKIAPTITLILCLYAVILALGIVTREIDRRTIDFLLGMPVDRRSVLVARVGVLACNTALVGALMWTIMRVDYGMLGLQGSFERFAQLIFANWLLAMAFGALTLLSSMWIDDYSFGVKLWLGAVAAGYFAELILRAAGLTRWQRFFSPFSYADGTNILTDGLTVADPLVLIGIIVAAVLAAIPVFERKQIAA